MARPIKETPVLTGNDARRFEDAVKQNENNKVSRENYARAVEVFKSVKLSCKSLGTEEA